MKKLNEILFITEHPESDTWILSFAKPEFQGGESFVISKEDAVKLNEVINH